MLKHHGRYEYSPIVKRPAYKWPGGKTLAVYVALNLDVFSFGEGPGAKLAPSGTPDVLNYAWRDYGNRVGVWRMLDTFEWLDLPVALLVNSYVYDEAPEVVAAFSERGDEIVAHGRTSSESQSSMTEKEESMMIREVTKAIESHEGSPPKGWLGPSIAESLHTPDILKAAGYRYMLDWCHDDQPTWFRTANGPILSIPYPQEINDMSAVLVRKASAPEFAEMIADNFDELLEQSEEQSLVCGISLHPYVSGQPFRLRNLRPALEHIVSNSEDVWITRPGEIADFVLSRAETMTVS
jgi:allantoinase